MSISLLLLDFHWMVGLYFYEDLGLSTHGHKPSSQSSKYYFIICHFLFFLINQQGLYTFNNLNMNKLTSIHWIISEATIPCHYWSLNSLHVTHKERIPKHGKKKHNGILEYQWIYNVLFIEWNSAFIHLIKSESETPHCRNRTPCLHEAFVQFSYRSQE